MSGLARTLKLAVTGDNASARKALLDTGETADKTAGDVDKSFTSLFSSLQSKGASALGPFEKSFDGIKGTAEKSLDGVKDVFRSKITQIAGGVSLGVLASEGFNQNIDIKSGMIKLGAQMGLAQGDAEKAGRISGAVYRDNFGESVGDVNEAIKAVGNNMLDLSKTSEPEVKHVTESVLGLADAFQVDVADATKSASSLMRNDLVQSSSEAMDVITKGFQMGLDSSGDFLDTLNEYSPYFHNLGIDGTTALGLLSQGLKAGARDTDYIADAFKEFNIRAIDGSTTTAEGYKALGLSAADMAKEIGKGGPAAEAATMKTLTALQKVKDPIAQNAAGTALFGTQWEDTMRQILPSMDLAAAGGTKIAGATDDMNAKLASTPEAKVEALKRHFQDVVAQSMQLPGPLGQVGTAVSALGPTGITAAAGLLSIATTAAPAISGVFGGAVDVGRKAMDMFTKSREVATVATEAGTVATGEAAVAEGVALGPILLVIAAVALLGFGIYELATHWSQSMDFIKTTSSDAWHWIDDNMVHPVEDFFKGLPRFMNDHMVLIAGILTGPFGAAAAWIYKNWGGIESWFGAAPGRLSAVGGHMWDWVSTTFTSNINKIIRGWNGLQFTLPSVDTHIPGVGTVGGFTIGTPDIPLLDTGGIVTGPTLAALSMNSVPEAVIPLPALSQMLGRRDAQRDQPSVVHNDVDVHVETNSDPWQIGHEVAWQMKTMDRAS